MRFYEDEPIRFHDSKVDEDPINFINVAYQLIAMMKIPLKEKAELVAKKPKGLAKIWYEQWIDERG